MSTGTMRPGDLLGPVQAALALTVRLAEIAEGEAATTSVVDELSFRAAFREGSVLPVDELMQLAKDGHACEIRVEQAGWSLTVRADGAANPSVTAAGDTAADFLDAAELSALDLAVRNGNATDALHATSRLPALVHITIRHRSEIAGFHWIATTRALCELLAGDRWTGTIGAITAGPTVLTIGDDTDALLTCRHLIVCGTGVEVQVPPASPAPPTRQGARQLPSPTTFADARTDAPSLRPVLELLQGVARTATWFYLASDAHIEADGSARVRIEGARSVDLGIRPADIPGDASADIALYEWATTSADPAVQDAVMHAASLAIAKVADLATAAAPVLRTARTLYELSRRGAIAEALATRRSARQAALDAARGAATAARTVASKAVERSLIQTAAAVAVILTNAARLVGQAPAVFLLVLIIAISVVSLVVAKRVEVPNARAAMRAELEDLDSYREAISEDDLDQIRALKTVDEAQRELTSAARTATWVYVATLVALAAVGVLLIATPFSALAAPVIPTPTPSMVSPGVP